jgi:hypothetical protein
MQTTQNKKIKKMQSLLPNKIQKKLQESMQFLTELQEVFYSSMEAAIKIYR